MSRQLRQAEVVAVAGVGSCHVHKELGRELVVPAQAAHDIAPVVAQPHAFVHHIAVAHFEAGIQCVVAHIVGGVEAAAVAEFMCHLGIEVVEIVAGVSPARETFRSCHDGDDRLNQQVAVGAPSGNTEGGLLLHDGAFEIELGGDKSHAQAAVILFVVAVVGGDVEHTAQSTTEMGRETALVEADVLHRVAVERREEAAQVVYVVHRHTVQQEQVLVGAAAAHIHARHALCTALYAGQQLHHFDNVGLAKDNGHRLHLLHGQLDDASLRTLHMLDAFATHRHLLQHHRPMQFHVQSVVLTHRQRVVLGFVAHKRNADDCLLFL